MAIGVTLGSSKVRTPAGGQGALSCMAGVRPRGDNAKESVVLNGRKLPQSGDRAVVGGETSEDSNCRGERALCDRRTVFWCGLLDDKSRKLSV